MSEDPRPRLLLVGGSGGLLGGAVLQEFLPTHQIRSLHRHPSAREQAARVEWLPADVSDFDGWDAALKGVEVVINVAWYRWGSPRAFRGLSDGLIRMLAAAKRHGQVRLLQVSVPAAPPQLESGLPYLRYKRQFDRAVIESGLSHRILRSSMLFGPRDVLLSVMLRTMDRYPVFPMFADGNYHVNPLAAADLARVLHLEAGGSEEGTVEVGGPAVYRYRDLTDLMFVALGKRPRYWGLSARGSIALAWGLQHLGSSLLYAYEVEWLLSDRLGVPPYPGLDRPLTRVEPFISAEAARLRARVRTQPAA
jgi:NADH dehydrogenase